MTASKPGRLRYEDALDVAHAFTREVVDVVERIEIAGSVRRQKYAVKDLEFVLIPRFQPTQMPLFEDGGAADPENLLIRRLREMLGDGRCSPPEIPCFGEKVQRVVYHGVQVECYGVVGSAQWAVAHAIRTGPAEFSKLLVTKRCEGGALPNDMKVEGLQLWRLRGGVYTRVELAEDERAFFHAIGFRSVPDPVDRVVLPPGAHEVDAR